MSSAAFLYGNSSSDSETLGEETELLLDAADSAFFEHLDRQIREGDVHATLLA